MSEKLRRFGSLVGAIVLCGAMASACGSDGGSQGKEITIGFVNPLKGHPFFEAMECGAKRAAKDEGVKLESTGASKYTVPQVIAAMNAIAAKNPDGIVMAVEEAAPYNTTIASLRADGTPFIATDGKPDDDKLYDSAVLSDNEQGGRLAGEEFGRVATSGGPILPIIGVAGDPTQATRVNGMAKAAQAAGLTVLKTQYSENNSATKVTSIIASTLARYPNLAGIFIANDADTITAVTALKEQGASKQVTLIGYDAGPNQLPLIRDGRIHASIAQRPDLEGELGVKYAVAAVRGESVPKLENTKVALVSAATMDSPDIKAALYANNC